VGDEPLAPGGKDASRFRAAFGELWSRVAREAADAGVLAGAPPGDAAGSSAAAAATAGGVAERLLSFLSAFSGSNVRALRCGAVSCGLAFGRGLVDVALRAARARDTASRQAAAEGRKGGGAAAKAAAAAAAAATAAAHATVASVDALLQSIYTSLFTHRFRDADAAIRAECITSLGDWALAYPSFFLKDYYLKYLGWALNDKDAGVRGAALGALRGLYAAPERAALLDTFTSRFAARLAQMARADADDGVAADAVRLLGAAHAGGAMDAAAVAPVIEALLDDTGPVRAAAAAVVPALLAAAAAEEDERDAPGGGAAAAAGKGKGDAAAAAASAAAARQLRGVLRILGAGRERAGAAACVVDALWAHLPALQDWDALAAAAAGDGDAGAAAVDAGFATPRASASSEQPGGEPARERCVTDAVHLLSCGARKLGDECAANTGAKAVKDARAKSRKALTETLMAALPPLLRAHGAHPARAAALAACVPVMQLELYALKRQEKAFAALLALLRDAFFKLCDAAPLAAVARALAFAAMGGAEALRDAGAKAADDTLTQLAARLKKLLPPATAPGASSGRGGGGRGAVGDAFELELSLRRLKALLEAGGVDGRAAGLTPQLLAALAHPALAAHEEVRAAAAAAATLLLLWGVHALEAAPDAPDAAATAAALAAERDDLVTALTALHRGASTAALKRATFALLTDLVWALAHPKLAASPAPALRRVALAPSMELLEDMWTAVVRALPVAQTATAAGTQSQSQSQLDGGLDGGGGALGGGAGASADAEAAEAAAVSDRMCACAARLVLFGLLPAERSEWLSGEVMSLWAGHGGVAAELAKKVAAHARKASPSGYWRTALAALKAGYARHAADEHSGESGAALRDLAARLAGSCGGAVPSAARPALAKLVAAGVDWALADAPARLPFLPAALPPFTAKLTTDDRRAVLARADGAAGADADAQDDDWEPFFAYRAHLADKAATVAPPPGSAAAAGGSAGKRSRSGTRRSGKRRKLAFSGAPGGAASAGGEFEDDVEEADDDDDDDDEGEEEEEEEEAAPPPPVPAARRRGAAGTAAAPAPATRAPLHMTASPGRSPAPSPPARRTAGAATAAAKRRATPPPPPAAEEEEDDDDVVRARAMPVFSRSLALRSCMLLLCPTTRTRLTRIGVCVACAALRLTQEEAEEEEEEAPPPPARAPAATFSRKRAVRAPIFATGSDDEDDAGGAGGAAGGSDDDEELAPAFAPAPAAKKSRR
jgi:cohesin complex subunit SA-1/2